MDSTGSRHNDPLSHTEWSNPIDLWPIWWVLKKPLVPVTILVMRPCWEEILKKYWGFNWILIFFLFCSWLDPWTEMFIEVLFLPVITYCIDKIGRHKFTYRSLKLWIALKLWKLMSTYINQTFLIKIKNFELSFYYFWNHFEYSGVGGYEKINLIRRKSIWKWLKWLNIFLKFIWT